MRNHLILGLILLVAVAGLVSYASSQEEAKDPVCGKTMKAAGAKIKTDFAGETYYFCSADCKAKFDQSPEKYSGRKDMMPSGMMTGGAVCCGMTSEMMKEVKMEKKDTPTGQIITMTSENPQVVKKLQEMVKQCQEGMMSGQHKETKTQMKEMMREHIEMMSQKEQMMEQKTEAAREKKEETSYEEERQMMAHMMHMEQMGQCKQMAAMGGAGHVERGIMACQGVCLMHNENYTSAVTNIHNGVKIEIKKK